MARICVAILWVVISGLTTLVGTMLIVMLFAGGNIPIGAAGLFASLPVLGLVLLGLGILGVLAGRALLKDKSWGRAGMTTSLALSLVVCIGSALAFWSWMGRDELIVKVILLGIGPVIMLLFLWIVWRRKPSDRQSPTGNVRECPDCGLVNPAGARECDCGHVFSGKEA
jgi:hypothetical protein